MSTRSRLRSLFHRHKDEPETSTSSNVKSSRYEGAASGHTPQRGSRPLSGSDLPSQTEPVRSRSRLRKSLDRRSHPAAGDSNRRSSESKRKSVDQRCVNDGAAPSVPDVPDAFKDQRVARPMSQEDAEMKVRREEARKSSHVMNFSHTQPHAQPLSDRADKYSEGVADWNIVQSEQPASPAHVPAPLNVNKTPGEDARRSSTSSFRSSVDTAELRNAVISRKPVGSDSSRNSQEMNARRRSVSSAKHRQRLSMDKPLPPPPQQSILSEDPALSKYLGEDREYLVKDSTQAPSLEGIVDLRNTVDTEVTESWAPAVVHEKVTKDIHHIREENITREIHNHDVYHRILPVIDIEVLPARHFVPAGNGELLEISADEIPGRTGYNQEWFVGEMLSKLPKDAKPSNEPRQFTARTFPGTEGDYKEYVSNEGVPRTETTWVHPPTIEEGGQLTGQTEPFYFGSENPADDGLRIRAPNGRVIGSSQLHAEQQERPVTPVTPPTDSMKNLSVGDYLQSVPSGEAVGNEALTPYEPRRR